LPFPEKARPGPRGNGTNADPRSAHWSNGTGGEGRISTLTHRYGWDRTRLDGIDGTRIWTGHGVLAYNLVKIAVLEAARTA
jgi:IS5 family transposase